MIGEICRIFLHIWILYLIVSNMFVHFIITTTTSSTFGLIYFSPFIFGSLIVFAHIFYCNLHYIILIISNYSTYIHFSFTCLHLTLCQYTIYFLTSHFVHA